MGVLIVRLIAWALVLAASLCIGGMFVGGLIVMFELGRTGEAGFIAMLARINELRLWGIVGIALFLIAFALLWFCPGCEDDQSQE